jgi:hypothetical protein
MRSKVVTLDLKGAFNGVNKISLGAWLQAKGVPTTARRWFRSFMENQCASIAFDDFETGVAPFENAGLAQVHQYRQSCSSSLIQTWLTSQQRQIWKDRRGRHLLD